MSTGVEPAVAPSPAVRANARTLAREIAWFEKVMQARITHYFGQESHLLTEDPPSLAGDDSPYAQLVAKHALLAPERLVLVLALLPHVRPQVLDMLFVRNKNFDRGFTEFGGWKGKAHGGFMPTFETAAFMLAGNDLAERFALMQRFDARHPLRREGILTVTRDHADEPFFSSALLVSPEYLGLLTSGERHQPDFSESFPARLITTPMQWGDLVLGREVLEEVDALVTWISNSDKLLVDWGLGRSLKRGYRSLFYGPPGTGKTLTATLIGQKVNADVYRIDLSMVVSKYIGETEKNLARVFDQAENRNWILFFDEADALFGKRTATSNSNDRHANQEVSYLLQRVEDFPGTVILASNLKGNIDDAFARRFQSLVHFPMPDAEQRLRLWQGTLQGNRALADGIDLDRLSEPYELSGGAIANVVRYGAIRALQARRDTIELADLERGIAKELRKEGRTV